MKTDKIVQQKIAQLEAALNALIEPKGEYLTNCMTTFNGKQVSIRSLSMPALMLFAAQIHQVENTLKETYLRYSVELPKELIHEGYPIKSWENDITFLAKRIQYNEQKAKLNNMIKRLGGFESAESKKAKEFAALMDEIDEEV